MQKVKGKGSFVLLVIVLVIVVIFVSKIFAKDKIEGCWIADTETGGKVCFDFDGSDYVYILGNGGISYGTYSSNRDTIVCQDHTGEEYTYGYIISDNEITIIANDGQVTLERTKEKVNPKSLRRHDWIVTESLQEIQFKNKKKGLVVNSLGEEREFEYELIGKYNEFLKLNFAEGELIYYITCDKDELTVYNNYPNAIYYIAK